MSKVRNYLSLIKFSHTIFAMPFAMIGFFLAISETKGVWVEVDFSLPYPGHKIKSTEFGRNYFDPHVLKPLLLNLLLVILCMLFARSAAMAFNRYLDRIIDAKNPRTAIREIPSGIITSKNALIFTLVSCALFIISCFFINKLCFYLSPVALLVVLGYSYTKRFTPLCHLVLGLGLSLAPIGAYIAVTGQFGFLPILFSIAVIFWVSGFDVIYALQDEEFDKSQNLYSIPAWLGKAKALTISRVFHFLSAGGIISAGILGAFGWLYWIGAVVFCGMLLFQHSIVKPDNLKRVNMAFMTANGIASIVFAIFVITDLFFN